MKQCFFPLLLLVSLPLMAQKLTPEVSSAAKEASTLKEKKAGDTKEAEPTEGPGASKQRREAAVSTIDPESLADFEHYPPQIKELVYRAAALTKLNLTYIFGSSDPKQGGMDCSGTVYHLLQGLAIKGVPRQSDEMCGWVQSNTLLHRTEKADSLKHAEFQGLLPGDLMFWSGTYVTAPRKIPVTHVMIYLGKLKKSGRPVVFGASDGRTYEGQRRTGVSMFDLSMPNAGGASKIYGYGLIPGIGKIEVKSAIMTEPALAAIAASPGVPSKDTQTMDKEEVPQPNNAKMASPAADPPETEKPSEQSEAAQVPKVADSTNPEKGTEASKAKSSGSKAGTTSKSKTKAKPKTKSSAPSKPPSKKSSGSQASNTPGKQISSTAKKVAGSIKGLFSN